MNVVALVDGRASALAGPVRQAVADTDRTQPVYDVETIEEALADSVAPRRFNLLLLAVFAGVALALAVIGVYGVMSYAVSQRRRRSAFADELGELRCLGPRGVHVGFVIGDAVERRQILLERHQPLAVHRRPELA